MAQVTETITVTVTGANPSTKTYSVLVDVGTGAGSLSIPLTGTNAGTDTITAAMTSHSPLFTSNPVQVAWWGATQILPLLGTVIETPMPFLQSAAAGSTTPGNILTVYYNDSNNYGNWVALQNSFNAGPAYVYLSGGSLPALYANGPYHGSVWKVIAMGNDVPPGESDQHNYFQITVGGSAVYVNAEYGAAQAQQAIVSPILAPPIGTAGTAQLRLTPVANGSNNWQQQGSGYALNLTIQNVVYTTIPYIPVLEGVTGGVFLYDSASPRFDFGEIGGIPITYPPVGGASPSAAAVTAAGAVSLSGDNTAWQGLFTLTYSGTSPTGFYTLAYNGGPAVFGVDVTNLVITADDIAWYDSANDSLDLFPISSGGVLQYPIQVAYMVMPDRTGITVTPSTLQANGSAQTLNVNLPKSLSPEQQGLYGTGDAVNAPTVSTTGGVTVTTPPSVVLDSNGYLTGWTMQVTVPSSSSSGSFQLTFGVTGTLTYLSGNLFVTNTVTYISGASPLATIGTVSNSYALPTNYSFVVGGGRTGTAPNYTITGPITLTAIVFSTDNGAFTGNFFRILGATKTSLGAATVGSPTPVAGGYHTQLTLGVTSVFAWGTPLSLGYTATDTLSTLSVSYTDTNTYNNGNPNPGGVGGCFTGSVELKAPEGFVAFEDFPRGEAFEIVNETGTHMAELLVHENYAGWMVVLDDDKLVTLNHLMKMADGAWDRADEKYADLPHVWFEGTVYNLHVLSDNEQDKHYILFNGDVAHNLKEV